MFGYNQDIAFPLLSPQTSAHAGHLQPTHHPPTLSPACVSMLAPLHSNFPQMGTELCGRAFGIRRTCVSRTTARGIGGSEVGLRDTGGVGYAHGGWQHRAPYLSWQRKRAASKRTNIQAALHSVVTAAWLFICVPPSEKEAAPIGSRCERKDRQQPD